MRGPALVVRLAALSGFLAVAFGAFAAHGAKDARAAELLHTGALYQMTHALAVFGWLAPMMPTALRAKMMLNTSGECP